MDSVTVSLEVAKKALDEEGFVDLMDSEVGEHVLEFEQKRFPLTSADGMEFLMRRILSNPVIRSIVEWFFGSEGCVLVHCLRHGPYPGHIESFLGGRDAGRRGLAVHLLGKGSGVDYYVKSHRHVFATQNGARRTCELSRSAVEAAGCEVYSNKFEIGGSVILDARLGYEILRGYAITAVFLTEDLVARTQAPPMLLPNLPELKEKVANMQEQNKNIRLNFAFQ